MSANEKTEAVNHDRRRFLCTGAMGVVIAGASILPSHLVAAPASDAVRPFRINIPEEALVDLRRRLVTTRWPDKETVTDQSQGASPADRPALVGILTALLKPGRC